MPNKLKYIFTLLLMLTLFAACKKCYICEKRSLCTDCEVRDFNGDIIQQGKQETCGTDAEIREFEHQTTSFWQSNGFQVNCVRREEVKLPKEVCGGPDKAEDEVFILELAGYKCINK